MSYFSGVPCGHPTPDPACPECQAETLVRDRVSAPHGPELPGERLAPGERIGRYIVVEPLGEGGMGVVYTAYDPQLDRKVALKLLRSDSGGELVQARLLREAQAMAQLAHPNVVAVFDVGEFQKSVFMAMEWVKGENLYAWMNGRLHPWRQTLRMFVAAGRGLEAAHRAGLVHRDFKPANVLVGEDDRPRVTDFGLARMNPLEAEVAAPVADGPLGSSLRTPLTRVGAVMGSPGYMAPEQYSGAPTTPATDQFSFCASLYQGLYGRLPFEGTTVLDLAQSTTAGKIAPPPRVSPVPLWIFRVLARGLATDPSRRHPSMAALLETLERDPARTRRRWLAAGAGLLAAGALAVGGRWALGSQARFCSGADQRLAGIWDDAARAEGEKAFAASGRPNAPSLWQTTQRQMDGYAQRWVDARTEACRATRVRGEQSEQMMLLRFACLDRRRDELGALSSLFQKADPGTVDNSATATSQLASLATCADLKALADPRQSIPEGLRQAVAEVRRQLSQGRALILAGKYFSARDVLAPAAEQAKSLHFVPLQAEADAAFGEVEMALSQPAQARPALERAVGEAESASDDSIAAFALSRLVSLVGYRLQKPDEARPLAVFTRGVIERMGGETRLNGDLAQSLGDLEWMAGNSAESIARYREALAAYTRSPGPDSAEAAKVHAQLGWGLMEQGAFDEAEAELRRALSVRGKIYGDESIPNIESWNNLGALAERRGRNPEAADCYRRGLDMHVRLRPGDVVNRLPLQSNLANALSHSGRAEEALSVVEEALHVEAQHPETEITARVATLSAQSQALKALHRLDEATRVSRAALEVVRAALPADHPLVNEAELELAEILAETGPARESLTLFDGFIAKKEKANDLRDPGYPTALAESARPLSALGRGAEARARLEKSLLAFKQVQDAQEQEAAASFLLAQALWASRDERARARALAERAHELYDAAQEPAEAEKVARWLRTAAR